MVYYTSIKVFVAALNCSKINIKNTDHYKLYIVVYVSGMECKYVCFWG